MNSKMPFYLVSHFVGFEGQKCVICQMRSQIEGGCGGKKTSVAGFHCSSVARNWRCRWRDQSCRILELLLTSTWIASMFKVFPFRFRARFYWSLILCFLQNLILIMDWWFFSEEIRSRWCLDGCFWEDIFLSIFNYFVFWLFYREIGCGSICLLIVGINFRWTLGPLDCQRILWTTLIFVKNSPYWRKLIGGGHACLLHGTSILLNSCHFLNSKSYYARGTRPVVFEIRKLCFHQWLYTLAICWSSLVWSLSLLFLSWAAEKAKFKRSADCCCTVQLLERRRPYRCGLWSS